MMVGSGASQVFVLHFPFYAFHNIADAGAVQITSGSHQPLNEGDVGPMHLCERPERQEHHVFGCLEHSENLFQDFEAAFNLRSWLQGTEQLEYVGNVVSYLVGSSWHLQLGCVSQRIEIDE
ncbi:hypothetical protein PM082_010496 [Marasmius tenuissimus]|nr:hypothetical protein PM082_010496 [Marasmius tenuissimus]